MVLLVIIRPPAKMDGASRTSPLLIHGFDKSHRVDRQAFP